MVTTVSVAVTAPATRIQPWDRNKAGNTRWFVLFVDTSLSEGEFVRVVRVPVSTILSPPATAAQAFDNRIATTTTTSSWTTIMMMMMMARKCRIWSPQLPQRNSGPNSWRSRTWCRTNCTGTLSNNNNSDRRGPRATKRFSTRGRKTFTNS